jgi:hypothetical protein
MLIATLMENSWLDKTLGSLKRRKCNFHRNFLNYVVFHLPSQEIYICLCFHDLTRLTVPYFAHQVKLLQWSQKVTKKASPMMLITGQILPHPISERNGKNHI